jgi:hypothetical protein
VSICRAETNAGCALAETGSPSTWLELYLPGGRRFTLIERGTLTRPDPHPSPRLRALVSSLAFWLLRGGADSTSDAVMVTGFDLLRPDETGTDSRGDRRPPALTSPGCSGVPLRRTSPESEI